MFRCQFNTDNDAFSEDLELEVTMILKKVAVAVRDSGEKSGKILDSNGNIVGEWFLRQ